MMKLKFAIALIVVILSQSGRLRAQTPHAQQPFLSCRPLEAPNQYIQVCKPLTMSAPLQQTVEPSVSQVANGNVQAKVTAEQCKADLDMWTGNYDQKMMLSDGFAVSLRELAAREIEMVDCEQIAIRGKGKHRRMNYRDAFPYAEEAATYALVDVVRMRMYMMRHNEWQDFETENVARYGQAAELLVHHALTPEVCSTISRQPAQPLPFDTLNDRDKQMAGCIVAEAGAMKRALLSSSPSCGDSCINYIADMSWYRTFEYATSAGVYDGQESQELFDFLEAHHQYQSFVTEDAENRTPPRASSGPENTPITQIVLPYDDENGSMLVKISINGRETTAVFDSGADVVTANLNSFGIAPDSKMNMQVADGRVNSVDAGEGAVCAGTPQVCLQVGICNTAADADVLLGQSFLSHFTKVMVDRRQRTIVLEP